MLYAYFLTQSKPLLDFVVISKNCLFQEFLITGPGNRLSSKTVIRLTSICPYLKWIGDLRDWNINLRERNSILPKLLQSEGWESSKNEPKDETVSYFSEMANSRNFEDGGTQFFQSNCLTLSDSYEILTKKVD